MGPIIFEHAGELRDYLDAELIKAQERNVQLLRGLSDEYMARALKEANFSYDAGRLEGVSEGLLLAADAFAGVKV
jgi:hypothetical protein